MPVYCYIYGCDKTKGVHLTQDDGISPLHFFGFPSRIKERGRFNKWVHLCGRYDLREEEFENKHVCSQHFLFEEIGGNRSVRARLSSHAFPTQNLPAHVDPANAPENLGDMERQLRKFNLDPNSKLLDNWNPESSNRETRKLTRKIYSEGSRKFCMYDDRGFLVRSEIDLCDCLGEQCPGCHFPCPKCNSCKCARECRNNRRWTYDQVEIEGSDISVKNKFK